MLQQRFLLEGGFESFKMIISTMTHLYGLADLLTIVNNQKAGRVRGVALTAPIVPRTFAA